MLPMLTLMACLSTSPPEDSASPDSAPAASDSPDSSTSTPSEDCGDGSDDDGDGLLDCEDEDCEASPTCVEVACEDGEDNDDDGWTDCEDEDCWSSGCDGATRARVLGGRLRVDRAHGEFVEHSSASDEDCGFSGWRGSHTLTYWSASAWGTVRAEASGEIRTCAWAVTRGAWSVGRRHWEDHDGTVQVLSSTTGSGGWELSCNATVDVSSTWDLGGFSRSYTVESGCGVVGTDFLPASDELVLGTQVNLTDGRAWYHGAVLSSYNGGWSSLEGSHRERYTTFGPLETGATFVRAE